MTKIKRYLGNQCLTSIYYSLVYPYLIYGCLLWENNYDNPLSQLIRLQNKAVRIIRSTQREYGSKPLKHNIAERILVFKR